MGGPQNRPWAADHFTSWGMGQETGRRGGTAFRDCTEPGAVGQNQGYMFQLPFWVKVSWR